MKNAWVKTVKKKKKAVVMTEQSEDSKKKKNSKSYFVVTHVFCPWYSMNWKIPCKLSY